MIKKTVVLLFIATIAIAQPSPAIKQRIESIVAAFNESPEAFEKYATQNFTAEALARGDAARRRSVTETVRRDFGKITVRGADRPNDTRLEIDIEGSTGARGAIVLDIEAAAPHRVTGMSLRIGGGREEGPALPPLRLSGAIEEELNTYI